MLPVTDPMIKGLSDLNAKHVPGNTFFGSTPREQITALSVRCVAESEDEAFEKAEETLAGFIDGLWVVVDHDLPTICPLAYVRNEHEQDARIVVICEPTWAYFKTRDTGVEKAWADRCDTIFQLVLPFFDIVAGVHRQGDSELARQLSYSLKMYRHGLDVRVYGLEFICKWSALEGLVCGGTRSGKRRLLIERLSALFGDDRREVEAQVQSLWITRNDAVHEAKAFRSARLTDSSPLSQPIEWTNELFLAVVTFAIAHLDRVESVTDLWTKTADYRLPATAMQPRPKEMPRFMVTACRLRTGAVWKGAGAHIDGLFKLKEASSAGENKFDK